jgi:hypothetical protein
MVGEGVEDRRQSRRSAVQRPQGQRPRLLVEISSHVNNEYS